MAKEIRLPGDSHRLAVLGRTGTGKTLAGLWHLSLKKFRQFPWIMFDAKGDSLINEIARIPSVERLSVADKPGKTGLYHVRETPPTMKGDTMEAFLWRIHARGKCGLFFDEGFVFDPRSDALNTILTQGRSLKIPCIFLSQRPSWVSRFAFSEADFFQVFALNDKDDRKTVTRFMPADLEKPLQEFHSQYYDVGHNIVREFLPVPPRDDILNNFDATLTPLRRVV